MSNSAQEGQARDCPHDADASSMRDQAVVDVVAPDTSLSDAGVSDASSDAPMAMDAERDGTCPSPPPPPPPVTLAELAGRYVFGPGSRLIPVNPTTGMLDMAGAIDLENEAMMVMVTGERRLRLESPTIGVVEASPVLHEQAAFTQIPDQVYRGNRADPTGNPDNPEFFRGLDPLLFEKREGRWGLARPDQPWRSEISARAGRKYELQVRCCPRVY
jgi:hypothetical protein